MDAATVAQRDQLEAELLEGAARVHAATAELAETLARFDDLDGWHGAGVRSLAHWCDINLGVRRRSARRLVEVSRRLRDLPVIGAAFADGALSLDKVLLVVPVATPATDATLAELARSATAAQLARICGAMRRVLDDESTDELEQRRARRGVTFTPDDSGLVRVLALLEPEEAATLKAAIDARVETAWRARAGGDDRVDDPAPVTELSVRRADALAELASEGLVTGPDPVVRGQRCEVIVHIDVELLAGTRADGRASIEGIGTVPLSTIERLSCDCALVPVVELGDGTVLNWGRRRREPTGNQRRALHNRDRGCAFPGCANTRFVDAHHVVHWTRGGTTDLDNLLLLCRSA